MAGKMGQSRITRDLVIVGGGPAGMSAALVAAGNGVDTLLLEGGEQLGGQVFRQIDDPVPDLLGHFTISGPDLVKKFVAHLQQQQVEYRTGIRVLRVSRQSAHLALKTGEGSEILARRVLLATGAVPRTLKVAGEHLAEAGSARKEIERFRGNRVVIVGGGDEAAETAVRLAEAGAQVQMLVRAGLRARRRFRSRLLETPGIEILAGEQAAALVGKERLEAVKLISGKLLPAEVCFIRIGVEVQLPDILPPLARHPDGRVAVDEAGRTSVKGIFAAGDITVPPERRYISAAIGQGAAAARMVEAELEEEEQQQGQEQ
ncbi:MAG: NAD(P)/FAD-dependent oxidoreductase [Calditrichaceae bacterium]|nr:NAD(P)/FAD-dependent oxidoreductase [Calditrichaceae bacterium]